MIAAVFIYEDNKADNDKSPLLGGWSVVESSGINSEGNFDNSAETLESYKILNITEVKDNFFHGKYVDQEVNGTYLDGRLVFRVADNKTLLFDGYVDGDTIEFILTVESSGDDAFSAYTSYSAIFSKDGSYKVDENSLYPDITGTGLKLVSGINAYEGKTTDFVCDMSQTLKIISQEKGALKGTMEQVVGDNVVKKQIIGNVSAYGDRVIGRVIDDTGNIWIVSIGNDYLRIVSAMESEISGIAGQPVAAERIYTPGGENAPEITQNLDLTGTEWKSIHSIGITDGEIHLDGTGVHVFKFTAQTGNLIVGTEDSTEHTDETISAYTYVYPGEAEYTWICWEWMKMDTLTPEHHSPQTASICP